MHLIALFALIIGYANNANIMEANGGAVIFMRGDSNFELAWQVRKFGVEGLTIGE